MMTTINLKMTGDRIYDMMLAKGITPSDVARECGFGTVQSVYKWWYGRNLPSIDNFVILADMLGTTVDDILVVERG